jgi:hypothetical protein
MRQDGHMVFIAQHPEAFSNHRHHNELLQLTRIKLKYHCFEELAKETTLDVQICNDPCHTKFSETTLI